MIYLGLALGLCVGILIGAAMEYTGRRVTGTGKVQVSRPWPHLAPDEYIAPTRGDLMKAAQGR